MSDCTVVFNDSAQPSRPAIRYVRSRPTEHGAKNFNFGIGDLVSGFPRALAPLEVDWLEILGALYAADLACPRGDDELTWHRRIELHVGVSDPDYWKPLAASFEDLFGRFTYDRLKIEFWMLAQEPPRLRKVPYATPDAVALMSGGMDSFVGALVMLDQGLSPIFISHSAGGAARTAQTSVQASLQGTSSQAQFARFTAQRSTGFGDAEGSQRSRTFLFVGVAALAASVMGIDAVHLSENGVMAIHAPLTEARIGSLSTRTAAPATLDRLGGLTSRALGHSLRVTNLLLDKTKPEVAAIAASLGRGTDLQNTVSCWSIGHTGKHCGFCAPCMMRRISMETHRLPDTPYEHNVFGDPSVQASRPAAADNLIHFVTMVGDLLQMSDLELELTYPEILNSGAGLAPTDARDLHRRWAGEAAAVLSNYPLTASML